MFWFGVNPRKVISRGSVTPRTSQEINGRLKVFFLITQESLICALIHLLSSDSKNENNTVWQLILNLLNLILGVTIRRR